MYVRSSFSNKPIDSQPHGHFFTVCVWLECSSVLYPPIPYFNFACLFLLLPSQEQEELSTKLPQDSPTKERGCSDNKHERVRHNSPTLVAIVGSKLLLFFMFRSFFSVEYKISQLPCRRRIRLKLESFPCLSL